MNLSDAYKEAERRLLDPRCASLFNLTTLANMDPIEVAEMEMYGSTPNFGLETLQATHYRILPMGAPTYDPNSRQVRVTGAATVSWNSVFINSQGPLFNMRPNVPGAPAVTLDMGTGLGQTEFAALLLLHELGHQVGLFRSDAKDAALNRRYTQAVIYNCFSDARNHR